MVFFLAAKLFADDADVADGCFLIALSDVVVDPAVATSVVADVEGESADVGWLFGCDVGGVIICLVFCSRLAKSLLVSGCGKLLNAKLGNEVTWKWNKGKEIIFIKPNFEPPKRPNF